MSEARLARAVDNSELERRINELEGLTKRLETSQTDRHLKIIAIIFGGLAVFITACAILITLLGWLSKTDSREATKDMQNQVGDSIRDMQKRFELLAGDALKHPSLQILSDQGPLENKTVEIVCPRVMSPLEIQLNSFFLKNTGSKRTEPISICLSMGGGVQLLPVYGRTGQYWEMGPSYDKDYALAFYSRLDVTIAQDQTWNVRPLEFEAQIAPTNITCKMQVFYGGDKPAEARFQIKLIAR
jgi:hypothetical protein